jgi:hypothetical protein
MGGDLDAFELVPVGAGEAPGGAGQAALRYLWRDPAGLIGSPAASSLLG